MESYGIFRCVLVLFILPKLTLEWENPKQATACHLVHLMGGEQHFLDNKGSHIPKAI